MWHRFNENLKRAILCAVQQAEGHNERSLSTRHVLHGIVTECDATVEILNRLGIKAQSILESLDEATSVETPTEAIDMALTQEAREAIERSYQIAADLGDYYIGGEHLLLGLVQISESSDASRVLASLDIDWKTLSRALMTVQKHRLIPPPNVEIPGLGVRRVKRKWRGRAGRIKGVMYGLLHHGQPFMPYLLFRRRTTASPYPFYARLRRRQTYWDPLVGHWVVTGYKDVVVALAEPRLSQRVFAPSVSLEHEDTPFVQREFRRLHGSLDQQMLFQDAPSQPRQRSLVAKRFTPRVIAQMREQMQTLADEMLDAVAPNGRMEVVRDLAIPYPIRIITRMLDLPEDKLDQFKTWSSDYFTYLTSETSLEQDLAAYRSVQDAMAYFQALIPERRQHPGDNLLTLLLQADDQGEYLPDDEVASSCLMLLATGHENTTRLLGSGLFALLQNPDQLQKLRDDPNLIGSTVEELLRYDSPVQWTMRQMREDLVWQGHALKQGQRVQIGLGAANRDPDQFANPDRLDIMRTENRHVAFGYGAHFCLGAALTRLEVQIVLGTLIARFPSLRLERPPMWLQNGLAFRGLESLSVRWD